MEPIDFHNPILAANLKMILIGVWGIASFILILLLAEFTQPKTFWGKIKIVILAFVMGLGAPALVALMLSAFNLIVGFL